MEWLKGEVPGIRTFRSPLFSLLRAKVPSGNLRSQERKFREQMFPGTKIPGIVSLLSDHGKGCWCCSESKYKKYSKMKK